MAAPITVSAQFKADFQFYCERAGLDHREQNTFKDAIRADFATVGAWVSETAEVYRFCDAKWPHGMPTARLCEGYLASLRWWPADPSIFARWGIVRLVRLCWLVSLSHSGAVEK